jgi:hypothetical protein
MAFRHVAEVADTMKDETNKDMCLTLPRELNASIRTSSTADLRSMKGGQSPAPSLLCCRTSAPRRHPL